MKIGIDRQAKNYNRLLKHLRNVPTFKVARVGWVVKPT